MSSININRTLGNRIVDFESLRKVANGKYNMGEVELKIGRHGFQFDKINNHVSNVNENTRILDEQRNTRTNAAVFKAILERYGAIDGADAIRRIANSDLRTIKNTGEESRSQDVFSCISNPYIREAFKFLMLDDVKGKPLSRDELKLLLDLLDGWEQKASQTAKRVGLKNLANAAKMAEKKGQWLSSSAWMLSPDLKMANSSEIERLKILHTFKATGEKTCNASQKTQLASDVRGMSTDKAQFISIPTFNQKRNYEVSVKSSPMSNDKGLAPQGQNAGSLAEGMNELNEQGGAQLREGSAGKSTESTQKTKTSDLSQYHSQDEGEFKIVKDSAKSKTNNQENVNASGKGSVPQGKNAGSFAEGMNELNEQGATQKGKSTKSTKEKKAFDPSEYHKIEPFDDDSQDGEEIEIFKDSAKTKTNNQENVNASGVSGKTTINWNGADVPGVGWEAFKNIAENKQLSDDQEVFFESKDKAKLSTNRYSHRELWEEKGVKMDASGMRVQLLEFAAKQMGLSSENVAETTKNQFFEQIKETLLGGKNDQVTVNTPLTKGVIAKVVKLVEPQWVKPELTVDEKRAIVAAKIEALHRPLNEEQKAFLKDEADKYRAFYKSLYEPDAAGLKKLQAEAEDYGLPFAKYQNYKWLEYQVEVATDEVYQKRALDLFGDICSPLTTEELEDARYQVDTERCEQNNPFTVINEDGEIETNVSISTGLDSMEGDSKGLFLAGDCRMHQGIRGAGTQEETAFNQFSMVTTAINFAKGNIKLELKKTFQSKEDKSKSLKLYHFIYEKDKRGLNKLNPFTGFLQRQFRIANTSRKPLDEPKDVVLVGCGAPSLGFQDPGYYAADTYGFGQIQVNRLDGRNIQTKGRAEVDVASDVNKTEAFYDYFIAQINGAGLKKKACQHKELYEKWQVDSFKNTRPVSARDDAMMIAAFGKYIDVKSGNPKAEYDKLIALINGGNYEKELKYALANFENSYKKQAKGWFRLLVAGKISAAMFFGIGMGAFHNPQKVSVNVFGEGIHEIGGSVKWYAYQLKKGFGQAMNATLNELQEADNK